MKKIILLSLIAILALNSCKQNEKVEGFQEQKLTGELIETDIPIIGIYDFLPVNDNNLIAFNFKGEDKFSLYNYNNNEAVFKTNFLKTGSGPYEMGIPRLAYNSNSNTLKIMAYSNAENKIFTIPNFSLETITDHNKWELTTWDKGIYFSTLCPINDSTYLAMRSLYDKNNMFSIFSPKKDTVLDIYSPFPDDSCEGVPYFAKQTAYNGNIVKHPSKDIFAYADSEIGRYAFIFEMKNDTLVNKKVLFDMLPKYKMRQDGLNISRDAEALIGIVQIFATDKYIYLMCNDFTFDDIRARVTKNGMRHSDYTDIYVFDWEGKPVKKLVLDKAVPTFSVDNEDKYIYGVHSNPDAEEETLLRFKIK